MKKSVSKLSKDKIVPRGAKKLLIITLVISAFAVGVCSCKAWRTISTTATYVQSNDSTKATATITTKTVEEYTGVKKRN